MHSYIGTLLILLITVGAVLPAFPILGILESQFPEIPDVFTIDTIGAFFGKAIALFALGIISMCLYADLVCPWLMRGCVEIFKRIK